METGTILIVDDNKSVLASLELLLENEFSTVRTAANPNQITTLLTTTSIDIVILDMNFSAGINNGNEGLYWLKHIHEIRPALPVVMLTAYGDVELAVKALKNGATDFLLKPWDNRTLVQKIKEAYNNKSNRKSSSKSKNSIVGSGNPNKPEMLIGHSPAMLQLIKVVNKVARTDANILITGENGTGKEMLAREIHRLSPRNTRPMSSIDMGAISESLFESELFGHTKGSFTDAYADRPGKFETADHSTLFLDEIGNLPYHLQAKLLTVLQRRSIVRVGSNQPIAVDIRLICATNRNLNEMVQRNEFREDLLYRINTIHLEIPPLRERPEDILPLAERFITRFCKQYDKALLRLSDAACTKLKTHPWYGNIRELEHAIEKAVIICDGNELPAELFQLPKRPETSRTGSDASTEAATLEEMERKMIQKALDTCNGNLSAVAAQLGITRQTLYNKMKKFGL